MSFVTLDFETYYDQQFSLKRLTTEEYIRDPRFEVIGVAMKIDEDETQWFSGTHEEIKAWLNQVDWNTSALLCHNTQFDGGILSFIFGIVPAYYFDTLCIARALHGVDAGGSLSALVKRYELGEKGTEVVNALGKKRLDFNSGDLDRYAGYCRNDVDLTYNLFNRLIERFPQSELDLIDMTIRMYTIPVLRVDDALLVERLDEIRQEKSTLLRGLMDTLEVGNEEEVRLGTKSTIEESRVERFIGIGARNKGLLPIPLKYYGAHTGRWAGADSVNFQNLPSRDKKKKALKNSVMAPKDHVVINCDSSQIEARVLAWLAGQTDVVEQFAKGDDVYSVFASKIYKQPISKANPVERFVGKTCILGLGYGTGAKKLQHTLKTQPPGADLAEEECKRIVDLYRKENDKITELWRDSDRALDDMMGWSRDRRPYYLGKHKVLEVGPAGIKLPNGLYIHYPNLRQEDGKATYDSRKGKVTIWGGAVVENVVQALARIIVGEQMLSIRDHYRPVLTVHDAAVIVAPKSEQDEALAFITKVMSTPPDWAIGLPVACEAKCGESYGDC